MMMQLLRAIALFTLFFLQWLVLTDAAQAETWIMVAQSPDMQELQYVDADSIEFDGSTVRLKTYWGMLDQPDSIHYAITEYRCQTEEYRDVMVNGQLTHANWQWVGHDPLNRAAMTYGCSQALKP